jgi:hypothetical protein
MRRIVAGLVAMGALCFAFAVAQAGEAAPDATLELKGGSVAVGVGFSWGSGTLTYQGKQYPISADGFDVGDVGVTNITASGKVYNLKNLADFDGNYTGVGAGATAMGGGSAVTMQNQNGVKVDLVSTTQGVKLALAVNGVKMKVKK